MAQEVTMDCSIGYDDGLQSDSMAVESVKVTIAGKRYTRLIQTIGIAEEAISLGEITAPTAFIFQNLDPTNIVQIRVATAGAMMASLAPDVNGDGKGGFVAGTSLGSGAQAPFAIALVAPCRLAVFVADT